MIRRSEMHHADAVAMRSNDARSLGGKDVDPKVSKQRAEVIAG